MRRVLLRLASPAAIAVVALFTTSGIAGAAAPAASAAATTVEVQADQAGGTVSPAAIGADYLYPFGGMGSFDANSNSFNPAFLGDLRNDVFTGSLRFPGGITADFYDWKRAIGPQAQRQDNPYGPNTGPSPSSVGPDEFGALLDRTGGSGVMTTNFSTGSAADAADEVAYMTGGFRSSAWADRRAANGHPGPYNVPVWEVGNEEQSAANSWRAGDLVTLGTPSDPDPSCSTVALGTSNPVADCEYIYGGTTSFTAQPVIGDADRSPSASISTGDAGQSFFVAYPPVVPGSQTISVGGQQWTEVSSLADAGSQDQVYTIDDTTGKITFGDNVHGQIPTANDQITASYQSGPHDGFNAYYAAMKAVNPRIQVCATDTDKNFVADMGSANPYDCLQVHPYESSTDNTGDIADFEKTVMSAPDSEVATIQGWQSMMQAAAGHAIPVELSEYGSLIGDTPDPGLAPFFYSSLDEALLNASQLADWINLGITTADRQLLTAELPAAADVTAGLPDSAPFATTAAIDTPNQVVQPTGSYSKLFQPLAGGTLLSATTLNNPTLTGADGDLSVVAARTGSEIDTVVINRSPTDAVSTSLDLDALPGSGTATVTTLNGPDALSFNTPAQPHTVTTTSSRARISAGTVALTFPAHSISLVQARGAVGGGAAPAPSVGVTASSTIADPGAPTTVTATIANPTGRPLSGTASLILPDGWTATPASASIRLKARASTTATFTVSSPATATAGNYDLGVRVTASGFAAALGSATVNVPETLNVAFDNVGITDNGDVTPGEYDGVQDSWSAEALAAATPSLTPGASFSANGLSFTWPDVAAGTDDNTLAEGQTIAVSGSGSELGFVGNSTTSLLSGTGTVEYTDGTTSSFTLTLGRFFVNSADTSSTAFTQVLTTPIVNDSNANSNGGSDQRTQEAVLYEESVPIDPTKTVAAVTLPNDESAAAGGRLTALHIFAVSVGTPAAGSNPPPAGQPLASTFDNVGITDNADVTPGEFDGVQDSWSAEALAAATPSLTPGASFSVNGLSFTWPDVDAGVDDNTLAEGQTISVSGSGSELGFVGNSTTALLSGTGTILYTDGTTSSFTLTLGRFFVNSADTSSTAFTQVLTTPIVNDSNANSNGGSDQRTQEAVLYEESVPIDPTKTVAAVTLPNDESAASGGRLTALHIFAISVGTPAT